MVQPEAAQKDETASPEKKHQKGKGKGGQADDSWMAFLKIDEVASNPLHVTRAKDRQQKVKRK